jgi:type I restriction enzyme S subunit
LTSDSGHKDRLSQSHPNKWPIVRLSEVVDILTGFPFKGESYSKSGIRVVRGENISEGFLRWDSDKIWRFPIAELDSYLLKESDVVIGMDGSKVGHNKCMIDREDLPLLFAQRVARLRSKESLDQTYLYYNILSNRFLRYVESIKTGTSIPHVSSRQILNFEIPLPTVEEQREIAHLFSSLDSKIKLNQKMNETLESIAQAIFKHWFIDFEFPNEDGKPYKSSGGEMVDSELGEIPKGWKIMNLDEIAYNLDSKRIPLSNREREARKGGFPYFGATGILDYVNDYLFDGVHILMGEDGSVLNEDGHPILQYVWGKFWVNNHAHVLRGKIVSNELLYLFLRGTKVSHIVTGAVQQKINQKNMNKLKFQIPSNKTQSLMENFLAQIFEKIRLNFEQNKGLSQIRDLLLPKLMTGKIRVALEEKENE